MMTGIPIENNLWTAYLLTIFFVVAGFAVYDVLYSCLLYTSASPTDKSPKEAPAPKSAGTPEGIITTDKDSILS